MPRVKRGRVRASRRRALRVQVKGFRWGRKNQNKLARTAIKKAGVHAFSGRKQKKRDMRGTFNIRINAAVREHGLSYSKFIGLLKKKNIELDRKVLSEIAAKYPAVFKAIVDAVK
ncbi:MAG: 50S ribosomal protein L20 [Patescibacteria group bacterium]|nr:50S ribosomal protein L20 [Patescibacteria group bacterium]